MSFWRGETLKRELTSLVVPFKEERIDCNAYTMRVGAEAFVSSADISDDPKKRVKIRLSDGEPFRIPPGQFAFLVTEELVRVPLKAMAFISMKTTHKLQGLINVSGFHVDPGWEGHLVFGVYNAGASSISLHRGQDLFLIWYANLDEPTAPCLAYKNHKKRGAPVIPEDHIALMSGEVFSPMRLADDIKTLREDLASHKALVSAFAGIAGSLLVALLVIFVRIFLVGSP